MTKTIEEAAREFMQTAPIEAISPYYEEDMVEMFKGGVKYALSQPLASRLTAEEKERVRKEYNWAKVNLSQLKEGGFNELDPDVVLCSGVIRALNRIFGSDFFKEERK